MGAQEDMALEDTAQEDTALEDTAQVVTAQEDTALEDTAQEDTALEDIAQDMALEAPTLAVSGDDSKPPSVQDRTAAKLKQCQLPVDFAKVFLICVYKAFFK